MQAYAVFAVNQHLETLLAEAARHRAVQVSKPSLRTRITARLAGIGALIEGADASARERTPHTRDHLSKV